MTEITWGADLAVGVQSNQSTINSTVSGLTTPLDSTDGIVLGTATAGTGETGITIPTLTRDFLEKPDESGTFTKIANSFLKTKAESFQIAFELKGNGAASTPSSGEALPLAGIDALLRMSGLTGANGTAPVYTYTPSATTEYGTVKLWVGGQSFVFGGCIVDSLTLPFTGGEASIAVANIRVGWVEAQAAIALPTADYGNQASLSAPVLEGAAYSWGYTRSAQNMEVVISNEISEIPDMNVSNTGIRLSQSSRTISVNGTVYQDDGSANEEFEYDELVKTTAPTADASWTLGTLAGASDTLNAALVSASNLQVTSAKYVDAGDVTSVEVQSHCTGASGGGGGDEFSITFL